MKAEDLRALQEPLKAAYKEDPAAAVATLHARGTVNFETLACNVDSPDPSNGVTSSGLHPKAGGDGQLACSGDMLLQSLVACSGVTLAAVTTAMGLSISSAVVLAEGVMDFRGTLGVDRSVPIGLTSVSLTFQLATDEADDKIEKLIQLTERYCVVLQTLAAGVSVTSQRGPA